MYRRNRFWKTVILRYGKKSLVLAAAFAVLITGAVSGTLAWMIDNTDPITNTFTYGDINIKLEETDPDPEGAGDDDPNNNTYEMMPGATILKDPKVTVLKDSKDCWLFVKLDKSENFDTFLTYELAEGWKPLDGVAGVYYREVEESAADQAFEVLKGDLDENGQSNGGQVKVKESVTKEMLNALNSGETSAYPTLTITAYAVQYDEKLESIDTAAEAWALAEADAAEGAADELSDANDDQSEQGDTPETT